MLKFYSYFYLFLLIYKNFSLRAIKEGESLLTNTIKVGNTIFYNLEDAITQSYREQQGTSGSASIEVEHHYLY